MMANNELFYFPHNCNTQGKKNIKKLIRDMGYEGYGLYWTILEFMYSNTLEVGEEDLIQENHTEKIKNILNNFGLFYIEDNQYMSDRILENMERVENKRKTAQTNANKRWLKKFFTDTYLEILEIEPALDKKAVEKLNELSEEFPNFKEILPNILYTIKSIKFDNGIKPGADWLLTETNFNKVYNRQFGWKEYKSAEKKNEEKRESAKRLKESEEQERKHIEEFKMQFKTKEDVFNYFKHKTNLKFLSPMEKDVLNEYQISIEELRS